MPSVIFSSKYPTFPLNFCEKTRLDQELRTEIYSVWRCICICNICMLVMFCMPVINLGWQKASEEESVILTLKAEGS